ncbi:MAG: shikimate dehydrogenase [Bacteroidota bacterium]
MKEYGLIGFPLSHSFSKRYFDDKFEKEQTTNASFSLFEVEHIDAFPALISNHKDLQGVCITIPHKKNVLPYLHKMDKAVQEVGACNCVRIKDGQLFGYNTDIIGFRASFEKHLKPHHKKALILGTGGASLGVEYVLKQLGIEYLVVSRQENLAINTINYTAITPELMKEYTVVINCTPLGTFPNIDSYPTLPYESITAAHYFFDLVYNPAETKFLSLAKDKGATIQNGYEMLVLQAEENWRIWNDLI